MPGPRGGQGPGGEVRRGGGRRISSTTRDHGEEVHGQQRGTQRIDTVLVTDVRRCDRRAFPPTPKLRDPLAVPPPSPATWYATTYVPSVPISTGRRSTGPGPAVSGPIPTGCPSLPATVRCERAASAGTDRVSTNSRGGLASVCAATGVVATSRGFGRRCRQRRGTRNNRRALSCFKQSVLVLRWLLDGTRIPACRRQQDQHVHRVRLLSEGLTVLTAQAPGLHSALLAAKAAGYDYVLLDGTLIETDRVSTPGPTPGVDLWWSARHNNHGGNVQVVCAPDGWPLWTSPVRPGREHDTACLRAHPDLLETRTAIRDDLRTLTDLGYEGEAATLVVAFNKPKNGELTDLQQTFNRAHNRLRAVGERGNSLLKMTFKAHRNVTVCPWKIRHIVAAALVILHIEHDRTT